MFGTEIAAAVMYAAEMARKQEECEREAIEALPVEMQADAWAAKRVRDKKRAVEATAERRHREMCQAVRDSRPSAVGGFGLGFILGMGMD